ncbi:hypothetical protein ABPG73_010485 [Tetrahymena malaccensis]
MNLLQIVNNLRERKLQSIRWRQINIINDQSIIYDSKKYKIEDYFIQKNKDKLDGNSKKIQSFQNQNSQFYHIRLIQSFVISLFILFKQKLYQLYQLTEQVFRRIPYFDPSSNFKIFWDLIQLMIQLLISLIIPFYVASGVCFSVIFPDYLIQLYKIMSILDIMISLNTGYFEQGHQVNNKRKIFNNYFKSSFLIDLISLIPIFVHFNIGNCNNNETGSSFYKLPLLLCLLKITQFSKTFSKIQERFLLTPNTTNLISLCKLLGTMIFVCHLFACSWVFLGQMQISYNLNNQNWLTKQNLQGDSIQNIYLHALYYSMTAMSTVGYGDITPISQIELLWSLFSILMSSQMFAYSINTIGQLLREFSKKEQEMQNKIYLINKYMVKKNVNKNLKYQIREYLEYYWQENDIHDSKQQESIINQQLSKQLREQLLMDSNRIILKDSPIFKHNFSPCVISKTLNIIQQLTCTPEDLIIKRGEISQQIFFIEKGEVDIIIEGEEDDKQKIYQKPKIISTLGKGKSFGMVGFFTGFSECFTVRSKEFCKLLFIKREDFLEILKEFSNDYEKFCYIKDNINLYDNLDLIQKKCLACLSTSHQMQFCPDTHYIPKKDNIIAHFNYKQFKQRYEFERKSHSYKNKGIALQRYPIQCFQNDNKEYIDDFYIKSYLPYYTIKNDISSQNNEETIPTNQNEIKNISQQNLTNNNLTTELDLQKQASKIDKDDFKIPPAVQEIYSNIEQLESPKKYFKSKVNINADNFSSDDQAEKSDLYLHQFKNTLNKIDSFQLIGSQQKIQDQSYKKAMVMPQLRGSFQLKSHSKVLSSIFSSQLKQENINNYQTNQFENQLQLFKETLLNDLKYNQSIEQQFEIFRNFEYYFPLNNLNFILQTQSMAKSDKKWYTYKYNKIYQDIYKQNSKGVYQSRRKAVFTHCLPHKLSPQIINQSQLLKNKTDQLVESNSKRKSIKQMQSFDKQSISTLQKQYQQATSISTNQYCSKKNQIFQQITISDSLQKSQFLHSQINPLQTTDQNIQKTSNCLIKQIDHSNIITNSSRINEFDDYEIQIEFEENISQAQQLNVVFPSRQLES